MAVTLFCTQGDNSTAENAAKMGISIATKIKYGVGIYDPKNIVEYSSFLLPCFQPRVHHFAIASEKLCRKTWFYCKIDARVEKIGLKSPDTRHVL